MANCTSDRSLCCSSGPLSELSDNGANTRCFTDAVNVYVVPSSQNITRTILPKMGDRGDSDKSLCTTPRYIYAEKIK